MGRRPGVFVRPVSMEEGHRLQRISRIAKDAVRLRRAIVVMMSAQGQSVPDITSLMQVSADYVRDVIHAFNEQGFEALDPKWSGGRPRMISSQVREHICLIARTSPADWKISAFSGEMPAPNRRPALPPTHPSAPGPSTQPRLPGGSAPLPSAVAAAVRRVTRALRPVGRRRGLRLAHPVRADPHPPRPSVP